MELKDSLGEEWYKILGNEFKKDYMVNLSTFVSERRAVNTVYPAPHNVFNAYRSTSYSNVRVCIIGQDPYINPGEAHGLAFSTYNRRYTPTLIQLEKAIRRDMKLDNDYVWNNDLSRWSEQGVMLLNNVLTVDEGKSGSHRGRGWENFITKTVQELDKNNVIFLLWGKDAQSLKSHIKHSTVIECEHPVAASYKNRTWENNDCFNRTNDLLDIKINW